MDIRLFMCNGDFHFGECDSIRKQNDNVYFRLGNEEFSYIGDISSLYIDGLIVLSGYSLYTQTKDSDNDESS